MVGHQTIRVHDQAKALAALAEGIQKPLTIGIVAKDLPLLVAAGCNVVNGAFELNSQGSGHAGHCASAAESCQYCDMWRVDPVSAASADPLLPCFNSTGNPDYQRG